jgi:hypothetical protein
MELTCSRSEQLLEGHLCMLFDPARTNWWEHSHELVIQWNSTDWLSIPYFARLGNGQIAMGS